MDPLQPWVDPLEMRRLAEALMTLPPHASTPAEDPGFNGEFIGFAPDPVTAATSTQASPQTSPPTSPLRASEAPVRGPFLERLTRYREWLQSNILMLGMFVLDKEGAVIFDDGEHERLYFMARSMAMAAKRTPGESSHVQMRVGSTGLLEVISVETAYGRMILALIVHQALAAADLAQIAHALQQAVTPPQS